MIQNTPADLAQRLAPLHTAADGVLYETDSGLHHIRIIKQHGQVLFYFVDRGSGALDGPMSRMDLAWPLDLPSGYTQAALLTLAWRPRPARVCILGLAGGRMSLALYYCFPDLVIDNVELDPAVGPIAEQFFGLCFDARQTLAVADARAFLEAPGPLYDIIIMDAFRDDTDQLDHLATRQFYQVCRGRLVRGGVLCANMVVADPRFLAKVRTLAESFRKTWVVERKHGVVLIGDDAARLSRADIARRAAEIERAHGFGFSLAAHAATLQPARDHPRFSRHALRSAPILDDPA